MESQGHQKLFQIPNAALLNARTLKSIYPPILVEHLSAFQLISLHLSLYRRSPETSRKDKELFLPYICSLPRQFANLPLWWHSSHPERLQKQLVAAPRSFQRSCERVRLRYEKDWENVCRHWVSAVGPTGRAPLLKQPYVNQNKLPQVPEAVCSDAGYPSLCESDFIWGWCVVNTRSVSHPTLPLPDPADRLTLAPFLDLVRYTAFYLP